MWFFHIRHEVAGGGWGVAGGSARGRGCRRECGGGGGAARGVWGAAGGGAKGGGGCSKGGFLEGGLVG